MTRAIKGRDYKIDDPVIVPINGTSTQEESKRVYAVCHPLTFEKPIMLSTLNRMIDQANKEMNPKNMVQAYAKATQARYHK